MIAVLGTGNVVREPAWGPGRNAVLKTLLGPCLAAGLTGFANSAWADSVLYLHPSAEVMQPWTQQSRFQPAQVTEQFSQRPALPSFTMRRRNAFSTTFGDIPVGLNLGVALRWELEKPGSGIVALNSGECRCAGVPAPATSCGRDEDFSSGPAWSFPRDSTCMWWSSPSGSEGFVADMYFDIVYRHFDASLNTPEAQGGTPVADVAFEEVALAITLGGGDIEEPGLGFAVSILLGYEFPRVTDNPGFFSTIKARGALTGDLALRIHYDFANWLYTYGTLSFGAAQSVGFEVRATSPQDELVKYDKQGLGDIPTHTGWGLGIGSRIPFVHW